MAQYGNFGPPPNMIPFNNLSPSICEAFQRLHDLTDACESTLQKMSSFPQRDTCRTLAGDADASPDWSSTTPGCTTATVEGVVVGDCWYSKSTSGLIHNIISITNHHPHQGNILPIGINLFGIIWGSGEGQNLQRFAEISITVSWK